MRYIQCFHESTGWNGKDFSGPVELIPKCGSFAVAVLDGRLVLPRQIAEGYALAKRERAPAFQIWAGRSFSDSRPVSKLYMVD